MTTSELIGEIETRDRVEIKYKDTNNKTVYVSHVEFINGTTITLGVPIFYGQMVKLPKESVFVFLFFAEKGLITFDGKILGYVARDGFNYMVIELMSAGDKVQRRSFFRFACVLPFNFNITSAAGGAKAYSGVLKDIGAGGMRFVSNESVEVNTNVKVLLDLDKSVVPINGIMVQKHAFPKANYKFQYRVKFTGVTKDTQEKIVQFIFDEQRRLLRVKRKA
jgi:c-di-GMP-binding flagellar brake protein YcgR